MDSVTQIALGASVGGVVAGRRMGRAALLAGALLGSAPDLDVLVPFAGAVESFTYHRSFSHSLIVLSIVAPLIAVLLYRFTRFRELSLTHCWLFTWLVLITHPLLDTFTVYGTQLFWPLSDYPVSGSSVFIIDPVYTIILLTGLAVMLLRQTVSGWKWNRVCLILASVYLGWSLIAKWLVTHEVTQGLARQGIEYERLLTTPMPFNTIGWRFVAMQSNGYVSGYTSLLDPSSTPLHIESHSSDSSLLESIAEHWPVTRLQKFTHGFYKVHRVDDNVLITDLRMGVEGAYVFNFIVAEVADNRVYAVDSRQADIDRDFSSMGRLFKRIVDPDALLSADNH
ncbi:MAG: metal-dependent hydrolase [Pseudomonadota bacterium]